MQAKSSKTTILDFMRSSSYAPQTAEAADAPITETEF